MESNAKLMFQPFSSKLEPGFWQQLTSIKLNKLKLSQGPVDITGTYSCDLPSTLPIPCLASFDHSSFDENPIGLASKSSCTLHGHLICTNQIKEFNDIVLDKKTFIDEFGNNIMQAIQSDNALKDPERHLSKVGLLVHADLKKYKFTYFFSFPALNFPKDFYYHHHRNPEVHKGDGNQTSTPILDVFSENALSNLQEEYDKQDSDRNFQRGYFIVRHFTNTSTNHDDIQVFPLSGYSETLLETKEHEKNVELYFAFTDPSSSVAYPGWPLRNYLSLIVLKFKLKNIKIIRIRKGPQTQASKLSLQHSMLMDLFYSDEAHVARSQTTGWEMNLKMGKPKQVDLSNLLDPKKLAEDAVNLNLTLMKWRLMPTLNLESIASTRCLILGCGTLGCHISRGLLAWGIKNISLIDNAEISYSNPVRQSLYTFEDCNAPSGNKFKAPAAAASLRRIHPTANINSYVLSVPMPGHHVTEKELDQTKIDIELLEKLIDEHDVVFLLMDTRESRWLPTVISMSKQKLVINAAIGFDTFLLQRYGIRDYSTSTNTEQQAVSKCVDIQQSTANSSSPNHESSSLAHSTDPMAENYLASDKLGCYFCNDIVAPGDSTLDRTLDQQCTVSRPGVSMMVSALAVELLASIMSSKKLAMTPAPVKLSDHYTPVSGECDSELGIVPHSIRGNLSNYHIYKPTSAFFEKCSACSRAVIQAYRAGRFEFLRKVFDDPAHLEEVSGLKDLQNVVDNVWAFTDDDEINEDPCSSSGN